MAEPTKRSRGPRVQILFMLIFVAMSSLVLRVGYLQIALGSSFRSDQTLNNFIRLPLLPTRGRIYSSDGTLLAYDQPEFTIYLLNVPAVATKEAAIAAKLAPVFKVSVKSLLASMATLGNNPEIRLLSHATDRQVSFVYEHAASLPGIRVQTEPQRVYPQGDLAGHVIGYVGDITSADESYYLSHNYVLSQLVGDSGVEQEYESRLQGKVGYDLEQTDVAGNPVHLFGVDPAPVAGENLQLTIDAGLQSEAQQIVENFVHASSRRQQIESASAVMIDVKTGAVLSLVSYPYYDPNWFVDGTLASHESYLNRTNALIDNAIQSPNYPGSAVKPANAFAGLTGGVITPTSLIFDPGGIYIGNKWFHNWYRPGFGWLNVSQALEHSDDTFFYHVGLRLGDWYHNHYPAGVSYDQWVKTDFVKGMDAIFGWEAKFGLGPLTGIDLPDEVPGRYWIEDTHANYSEVPYPLHKAETSMKKTGQFQNWGNVTDLAFADIGQSQEYTPIEMAQYVATLANNGVKMQPHVVQSAWAPGVIPGTPGAKPVWTYKPKVQSRVQAPAADWNAVHEGMYLMANAPGGLLYQGGFQGSPYRAAGKTGSAQISINGKNVTNSVTIAYAPYKNPQVAVAIMVPGGGNSTNTATYLARDLLDAYFKIHHEYYPKSEWLPSTLPANWASSPAAVDPKKGIE